MKVLQNWGVMGENMFIHYKDNNRSIIFTFVYSILKRNCVTPSLFFCRNVVWVILIVTFLAYAPIAYSETIDEADAKLIAMPLMHNENVTLAKQSKGYFIFTNSDNSGFVIVRNRSEVVNKIIGYSTSSGWTDDNMPPYLLKWLNSLDSLETVAAPIQVIDRMPESTSSDNDRQSVPVLLTSRWHQSSPYNDLCPVIEDGNIKTVAGCVAIAAAQVVYYWRKDNPAATSEATPVYPYGSAPVTYSVPAGTEYEWDLMRDYYTLNESDEEKAAVARLAYIIGTSAYLQYGSSTGGQINDIITPFSKQFRLNAEHASKKKFSQSEWEQLLYDNLLNKRPIVYAGNSNGSGHAVVVDGYDADTNLFHFNFGWGGSGDGYYTVDDETGMNGYNNSQGCVYNIYPLQRNFSITINANDALYANDEVSIDISIKNNSTLKIENLYMFVSSVVGYPTDPSKAVWSQNEIIENDGTEYAYSANIIPGVSGDNCFIIITDGNLNVLTQKIVSINAGSGIEEVTMDDSGEETYYSIKGEILPYKPITGVYIKRKNNIIIKEISH
ncbi:MAG: C10 family peptidase [Muribaculaceae bacterium]